MKREKRRLKIHSNAVAGFGGFVMIAWVFVLLGLLGFELWQSKTQDVAIAPPPPVEMPLAPPEPLVPTMFFPPLPEFTPFPPKFPASSPPVFPAEPVPANRHAAYVA